MQGHREDPDLLRINKNILLISYRGRVLEQPSDTPGHPFGSDPSERCHVNTASAHRSRAQIAMHALHHREQTQTTTVRHDPNQQERFIRATAAGQAVGGYILDGVTE